MRTSALWVALLLVFAAVAPASALAVDDLSPRGSASPAADMGAVSDRTADVRATSDRAADVRAPSGFRQLSDGDGAPAGTTVEIDLQSDRSAEWRIETHYTLDSQNETRAFRTLASQYEAGEADVGPSRALFESLQERASESTGRSMAIENVTYHSSIDEEASRGTLALTFRWTGFLRQGANGTFVLDDVFTLPTAETDEERTWLSIFGDDQQILIRPPDGYTVTGTSIPVQQRESAIILAEPSDFEGEGEALEITYTSVGPADQLPLGLLAGGGFVAIATLLAGFWLIQRSDERTLPWNVPSTASDAAGAEIAENGGVDAGGQASTTRPAGDVARSSSGGDPAQSSAADSQHAPEAATGDDGTGSEPDLSLLSDEERVEHLLERNGGRMKQATIVDETDWSDAKVSQLLSAMADEGRVNKLRLGRENLISLPEDDGDGSGNGTEVGTDSSDSLSSK
ncbi:helix-turn-helix transcriptional regulator [Halobellus captivus]|uniref:helix-turn-helix transcriptional regulator n=1 Tax=Halobellus captivus TaxID=2592614 RepID=UPI0011AAE924|nr:hypothetical protein [Halobellus captivus]